MKRTRIKGELPFTTRPAIAFGQKRLGLEDSTCDWMLLKPQFPHLDSSSSVFRRLFMHHWLQHSVLHYADY
ncbi:MAG: hypothetical protein NWF00_07280 [Candidatus Bathyarchaeota archaeon]|nr:hypothetical protein [Candidatus Bathyarchaeota archaeon]